MNNGPASEADGTFIIAVALALFIGYGFVIFTPVGDVLFHLLSFAGSIIAVAALLKSISQREQIRKVVKRMEALEAQNDRKTDG